MRLFTHFLLLLAAEHVGQSVDALGDGWQFGVRVDVHGQADIGMPHRLHGDVGVDAVFLEQRGVGVADGVDVDHPVTTVLLLDSRKDQVVIQHFIKCFRYVKESVGRPERSFGGSQVKPLTERFQQSVADGHLAVIFLRLGIFRLE